MPRVTANKPNKIKFNLKNVYFAPMVGGDIKADKTAEYETPFAVPGDVSIALSPEGEMTEFFADGVKYFVANGNAGYKGELELALVTNEIKTKILGFFEDSEGKLIEDANAPVVHFAMMFQFDGDARNVRHTMYNVTIGRPSLESKTKEKAITPQTEKVSCDCSTIYDSINDTDVVKAESLTTDTTYDSWFDAVKLPTAAVEPESEDNQETTDGQETP